MIYLLGILICLAAGFLIIRLMANGRLNLMIHILFSLVLGLGIAGTTAFYTHILCNQFNHWLPVGIVAAGIFISWQAKKGNLLKEITSSLKNISHQDTFWGLCVLGLLIVPLAISGHYYPLGGWDAWSCWSLKAKFIFLGQENWKEMLSPDLWRSNTHYPILWPLINVWFWDLGGTFDQAVPMLNSILIALLTAGILLFGLLELTGMLWLAILASVLVIALPFNITLFTSQYSDALLGLFLISAFVALLLAEKYRTPQLKILTMVFLGLMSFTKNEGLMAAAITSLAFLWHQRAHKKELPTLFSAFLIGFLPTIIFTLFFAPKNEAFINGLLSADKPTNWTRVIIILVYPWFEFISIKWNGFWLLALGGILLGGKKLWQSTLGLIAISLVLYIGAVLAYYAVNTFFEINWWLQTTLSRIIFALIPTIALWIGLGISNKIKAS